MSPNATDARVGRRLLGRAVQTQAPDALAAVDLGHEPAAGRERGDAVGRRRRGLRGGEERRERRAAGAVTLQSRTSPSPSSTASACGVAVPSATTGVARKRGSPAAARRGGSAEKLSPASALTAFCVEYRFGEPPNVNAPLGSCWESR